MKMTMTVRTIEITDDDFYQLQQGSISMDTFSPELVMPQEKIRTKRKTRSKRKVTASELLGELIEGIKK